MNKIIMGLSFAIIIVLIGLLVYIPFRGAFKYKFSNYQGKVATTSNLKTVLKNSLIKDYFDQIKVTKTKDTYQISISLTKNNETDLYVNLEHQAAILVNVFKNVDLVTYNQGKRVYPFSLDWLVNALTMKPNQMTLEAIKTHYDSLPKDKIYLGNINGAYNIYDTSLVCDKNYIKFYENEFSTYELNCASVNDIELVNTANNTFKLMTALDLKLVLPDNLFGKGLDVQRTSKSSGK